MPAVSQHIGDKALVIHNWLSRAKAAPKEVGTVSLCGCSYSSLDEVKSSLVRIDVARVWSRRTLALR
jgi:hypothetical protein